MGTSKIRTDLALEVKENIENEENLRGIEFEESYDNELDIKITRLKILNTLGEKNMGRAIGSYYTFETMPMSDNDGSYHREISEFLAVYIRRMVKEILKNKKGPYSVLIAGLGNREATPDALGPYVINNLCITRNFESLYSDVPFAYVSGLIPGVMAQTGMETAEILRGIVEKTKPDCIIVVDALAARNASRLANTIQLTDTGIMPGSGVGNHRNAIDKSTMGVPVIAIGVPTVVDAATIVNDALENFMTSLKEQKSLQNVKKVLDSFSNAEKMQFMRELMPENMSAMYVTPKDVDETVKRISFTISEAINICMSQSL